MSIVAGRATTVAVALAGVLSAGGCGVLSDTPQRQTVVIGVDLPLTGAGAATGAVHRNALELRVAQINQQQLAGEAFQLELRLSDNRADPAAAAGNLATLAADPQVVAIITAGCPDCVTAADLAVPIISLDRVDVAAGATDPRFVFRLGPEAEHNADRLSQAMTQAGVRTVGLLTAVDSYGQAGAAAVGDAATRDGLSVVVDEQLDPGDETTVQVAAQAVAGWSPDPPPGFPQDLDPPGPDAVVLWADPPDAAAAAAVLRRAGYEGPLFVDISAGHDLFLTEETATLEGATMVGFEVPVIDQLITASPAAAARADWHGSYVSAYGTYHMHASWAADAVGVLAAAMVRAGSLDRARVRDELENTRTDGLSGLIRFTAAQHSGLHPSSLLLLSAAGGRWHPHQGFDPAPPPSPAPQATG